MPALDNIYQKDSSVGVDSIANACEAGGNQSFVKATGRSVEAYGR